MAPPLARASRRSLARDILTSTTSLTALLIGMMSGPAIAGEKLWYPSVGAALTHSDIDTIGSLELFAPVTQSDSSVFFVDLRLDPAHLGDFRGSYGAGIRHIVNPDLMIGAYGFYNNEVFDGTPFRGVTVGAEFLTPDWDGHLNYHHSLSSAVATGGSSGTTLSLVGNDLMALVNTRRRVPLDGVEAEIGYTVRDVIAEGNSVRLSGGAYHYFDKDTDFSFTGVKAGLEFEHKFTDSPYSPRLTLGGKISHDNANGTGYQLEARLRIPLGGAMAASEPDEPPTYAPSTGTSTGAGTGGGGLTRDRLNERIRVTGIVAIDQGDTQAATVIDPNTGNAIGRFFFADDANSAGAGTFDDPTTLDDAITNAGNYGFVVGLENGLPADISTAGSTLLTGQSLLGGGTSVPVLVNGTPINFTVPGTAGTIDGTSGNAVITLADENIVRNLTVTGGGYGISGDGIANGTIDNVTLRTTGDDAIRLTNTTGTQTISNFLIDGTGDDGIFVEGVSKVTISDGSIDNTTDQGIDIRDSNVDIESVSIGTANANSIGNQGIIIDNDAIVRTVNVTNVTIGSATAGVTDHVGAEALSATSTGTGKLSLNLSGTNILRSSGTALSTLSGGPADNLEIAFGNLNVEAGTLVPAIDIMGSQINATTMSTVVRSAGTITVNGNGTGGGIRFDSVRFDADAGTAGDQQVAFGAMTIGSSANRVQGDGLSFLAPTGDVELASLHIFNNLGTGLEVDTKVGGTSFNLDTLSGSIETTNGAALFLDPLTGNMNFSTVTSTNATNLGATSQNSSGNGSGVTVDGLTSGNSNPALTIGTLTVTNPGTAGILINDSADINFGTSTITLGSANTQGIDFQSTSGDVSFGATTITGVGSDSGQTGVDFNGAALGGMVDFASIAISGPSTSTDSIGVDLTGVQGNQTVNLGSQANPSGGPSSSISGLHRGVVIDPTGSVQFTFGDGEAGSDTGSSIDVNGQAGAFTVDAGGGTLPSSTYDFADVTFGAGDSANFPTAPTSVIFISTLGGNVAAGTNGLSQDVTTITVADAEALADNDQIFVFVGDSSGIIDVAGGGTDGFTLLAGQSIDSFNDGNTITFGTIQPVNVTGSFGVIGGSLTADDVTATHGGGAGTTVISSAGGGMIENFDVASTGTGIAIGGASSATTVSNVGIDGQGGTGTGLFINTNAAAITLNDVDITATSNGLRETNGTGTGSVTFDAASSIGATSGNALSIENSSADFTMNGSINETDGAGSGVAISNSSGTIAFNGMVRVDTGTSDGVSLQNNTGATIGFTGGLDIDTTTGTGLSAAGGGTLNTANTAGVETITSTGGEGLTLSGISTSTGILLDSVTSGGGAVGFSIDGLSGAGGVDIVSVDVSGATTTGVSLANITTTGDFTLANIAVDVESSATGLSSTGGHTATLNLGTGALGYSAEGADIAASFTGTHGTVNLGTGTQGVQLGGTTAIGSTGLYFGANSIGTFAIGNAATASLFNIAGAAATDDAIHYDNSDADVTVTSADINGGGGYGVRVEDDDGVGTFTMNGTNTIDGTGSGGIMASGANVALSNITLGATSAITGTGVSIDSGSQDVTAALNTMTVTAATGVGIDIDGTGAGSLTITDFSDLTVTNANDGVIVTAARFDADGGTSSGGDADFTGDTVTGGNLNIGQGGTVVGSGLSLLNVSGDLDFSALNIDSNGAALTTTSLSVFDAGAGTGFKLSSDSGAISSDGAGVIFDTVEADTTLTTIASGGGLESVSLFGVGGSFTVTGDVTISGSGTAGIAISGSSADIEFQGTTTISSLIDGADGIAISGTNSGTFTFGDVDITGLGAAAGLNLNGATLGGALSFNSLDITGTGAASSIGIDLTGLTGGQFVNIGSQANPAGGPSSTISNVERGVVIGSTTDVQFTFGDGESASDRGSSISVISGGFTVDAGNGTLGTSNFDFDDVTFGAGNNANFPLAAPNLVFVSTGGGTIAAGTNGLTQDLDTITVAQAEALSDNDQVFVFVGNSSGIIDVAGGGADGFTLLAGQSIDSFNDGNAITIGSIQPVNITGDFGITSGTVTANNVTATHVGAASTVVTSSGGGTIENFDIASTGSGIAILGASSATTVSNVAIDGLGGTGTGLFINSNAAAITINDVDITSTGYGLRELNGTGAGSVTVDAASSIAATSINALSIDSSADDFTMNGSINETDGIGSGVAITNATGTINVNGALTLNTGAYDGVQIGSSTNTTISFDAGLIDIDTTNGSGLNIFNNTGTTISFLNGFDIDTGTGTGITATGSQIIRTVDPTGAVADVTSASGTAINLNGTTIAAGGMQFSNISASGSTNGIVINNVSGGTFSVSAGGTVNVSGSSGDGIVIEYSSADFDFGSSSSAVATTVTGAGANGVKLDSNSGTIGFGSLTISGASNSGLVATNNTGAITIADATVDGSAQWGVRLANNSGTFDIEDGTIGATTSNIVSFFVNGGSGDVTMGADITQTATGGSAVQIASRTTGTVRIYGDITASTGGSDAIQVLTNIGGTITFDTGVLDLDTTNGTAIHLLNNAGAAINFLNGFDIDTTTGAGFRATGGGTIRTVDPAGAVAADVTTAGGMAIDLNSITVDVNGMAFSTVTTNGGSTGIAINTVSGGAISFDTVSITNPGAAGIDISNVVGSALSFGDIDIALGSDNSTALDLSGATINANLTATDFDVTSTSATGTIGIDLTGTTGSGAIRLGDTVVSGGESATIAGVAQGVLFSSATNASFVFGDGEGTTDVASSISATTPIAHDGSGLPVNGSYNFLDATLTGDTSVLGGGQIDPSDIYYVTAAGTGDGSMANPGSLTSADAEATASSKYIALVNTNGGGTDTITGSIALDTDQWLVSFLNGDVTVSDGGAPSSFTFSTTFGPSTITDPTGNGAPLLTTSAFETVSLSSGSVVDGILATNSYSGAGVGAVIRAEEVDGTIKISNSELTRSTNGYVIRVGRTTAVTTTFEIANNTIGVSAGSNPAIEFATTGANGGNIVFGTILNNVISTGDDSEAIVFNLQSAGTSRLAVFDNNFSEVGYGGVSIYASNGADYDLTIQGNQFTDANSSASDYVFIQHGASTVGCANIGGGNPGEPNTFNAGAGAAFDYNLNATSTLQLTDYDGLGNLDGYIAGRNNGSVTNTGNFGSASPSAGTTCAIP